MAAHTLRKSPHPPGSAKGRDHGRPREERQQSGWDAARERLAGLPGGRLNIAYEAVDRHVAAGRGDRAALRRVHRDGRTSTVSYAQLARSSARFAQVLAGLGVGRGDRVCTLLGPCPELFTAVLGTLKHGSVAAPLFSSFGPGPVRQRLRRGDARVLVTTEALYHRKVADAREHLPELEYVLLLGHEGAAVPGQGPEPGVLSFDRALAATGAAGERYTTVATGPGDMALLHFTSGTSGPPKGAVHVHEAVVAHHATAASALGLRPDDVYWCTADPGWVTGMSYGLIAPLTHGATVIVDEGEYGAERWLRILAEQEVTVWYTSPTALRMLMRAVPRRGPHRLPGGAEPPRLPRLRFVAGVGEPLNPEVVRWGREVLGLPVHDTWWQTETGCILIANPAAGEIRPGSMGRPLPGVEAAVLERGGDGRALVTGGRVRVLTEPGAEGELALRPGWPSMFRGYLHDRERYERCFAGGWYLTGDVARVDEDGWYWFVGRADDVIVSSGHLIGPFEVESALMEHPAVAEAGVVGTPHPVAGEIVKAFVSLRPGERETPELRRELLAFGRERLGPAVAPRDIVFDRELPKTRSGKVMRRLLRARGTGSTEGGPPGLRGAA
ncbi:acetate--CoA ligase [Streptomyces albus]|uniref:acetate--CoA ligase n=1 Tax=Streptomyces albus TaxID=1888 RepID=UPI0004C9B2BE|nr:acetate--CoA ligase [Streptomyces albus]